MAYDSITAEPTPLEKRSWFRVLWACALGVSFVITVYAVFRGGYIGTDYNAHLNRIVDSTRFFDFSMADPPIYILMGHGLFRLIGRGNAFPFTQGIIQAIITTLAMWCFFLYSERRFKSPLLHLALVFFLAFLPVRVVHSVSCGTDWMTVPVFVLLLFLFDKFRSEETSTSQSAAFLGLGLALGIWSKYSFMALLPAIFAIFAFLWWKRAWKLKRFVTICALSLVLPSALVFFSFWKSTHAKDPVARTIWLPKGGHPEMDWKDLLLVKKSDLELFKAPEMFKREPEDGNNYHVGYRAQHKHSYLGLVHMNIFTDTMNLFQDLPMPQGVDRHLIPDFKTRRPWKTPFNAASMYWGTTWTVLALLGTPLIFVGALKHLWKDKLEREDTAAFLAVAYFLLMFLAIPFMDKAALQASWTPRLILAPLLFFSWAGFLLLDRTIVAKWEKIAFVVIALVLVQSGIEIVILV